MISLNSVHKSTRRPINLFLSEMIIALLFFSISGAVILRVFAAADIKSRKSARLENVIICAQSLAEAYSETADIDKAARLVWTSPQISETESHKVIYSTDREICLEAYEQRTDTAAGELSELKMVFTAGGEEIYTMTCSAYMSREVS